MVEGAFLHFPGIGKKKLELLFRRGIIDWETALRYSESIPLGPGPKKNFLAQLERNRKALDEGELSFFVKEFHPEDRWRILADFFDKASFFDIETDGYYNRITTISVYHKEKLHNFTRYENLEEFLEILGDIELMVSFNGSSFDVPVVLQNFRIPEFPVPHLDLRWICYHEGIRGGLKDIERFLNIRRPADLSGVDGMEAILLWSRWMQFRDLESLKHLKRYCSADVLSLVKLSEKILSKKLKSFPASDDGSIWNLLMSHPSENTFKNEQ